MRKLLDIKTVEWGGGIFICKLNCISRFFSFARARVNKLSEWKKICFDQFSWFWAFTILHAYINLLKYHLQISFYMEILTRVVSIKSRFILFATAKFIRLLNKYEPTRQRTFYRQKKFFSHFFSVGFFKRNQKN